ncbi:hypothetical protein JXJ21_25955 [candidate division KSB1 bacterium]|nr:hypothetical protein [candidate division KSB1 bacterium]
MIQSQNENPNESTDTIDLWEYAGVIVKNRWMIVRNCIIIFFLSILISLILPKKYSAVVTLLPPDQNRSQDPFSAFAPGALSNFNIFTANTTTELFVQILLSRTVQEGVLKRAYLYENKKVSLLEYFDTESLEDGRKLLGKATSISASPEGIISLAVELGNPVLAAAVANAYIAELDSVNQSKNTSKAKNSRVYIENQLQLTQYRLDAADSALAKFQETHKAISLENQTRTAIEEAGRLKGLIIAKEVELATRLHVYKSTHPTIRTLQNELTELRIQYWKLQYGSDTTSINRKKEFYIPMAQVPGVASQLAELMREVKVQETIWEMLNQQYYQAKIQEAKDTPTVEVLDRAVPPEYKSKPRRMLIVVLSVGVVLFFSIFWAFLSEYLSKLKQQQENEKIAMIKKQLDADALKVRRFLKR